MRYRKVVIRLLASASFNSSDVFLLLKAKQSGASDTVIIGIYIFYNLIYAAFAFPLGTLADKIGLKKMLISGIGIFSIVYFGMGFNNNSYILAGLFALYGIYAAATEGISKAWISNITNKKDIATAIGYLFCFSKCLRYACKLHGRNDLVSIRIKCHFYLNWNSKCFSLVLLYRYDQRKKIK